MSCNSSAMLHRIDMFCALRNESAAIYRGCGLLPASHGGSKRSL